MDENFPEMHHCEMPSTTLSDRIQERMTALNLKAAPLAKSLGLSDSFIRDILRKGSIPGARNLDLLAGALQTSSDYLLGNTDQVPPAGGLSRRIPLLTMISAGALMLDMVQDEAIGNIIVSDLPPGDWIALRVSGDSMDRISPPESTIFVDRHDKHLVPNGLYVIADEDGSATYKRFRPGPPMRFEPVSTNPTHEPLFPEHEPTIVGRVKRSVLDTM
jgi:SOS-response transcriptional repressor LexA